VNPSSAIALILILTVLIWHSILKLLFDAMAVEFKRALARNLVISNVLAAIFESLGYHQEFTQMF
jgi:hypothetical protein